MAEGGADGDEDDSDEALVRRRAVHLILSDLTNEAKQAFLRVVGEGHDPAEVARELGMTVNAVYLVVSRVKRRFREEFAGLISE